MGASRKIDRESSGKVQKFHGSSEKYTISVDPDHNQTRPVVVRVRPEGVGNSKLSHSQRGALG